MCFNDTFCFSVGNFLIWRLYNICFRISVKFYLKFSESNTFALKKKRSITTFYNWNDFSKRISNISYIYRSWITIYFYCYNTNPPNITCTSIIYNTIEGPCNFKIKHAIRDCSMAYICWITWKQSSHSQICLLLCKYLFLT